jgi:hypothetical protein
MLLREKLLQFYFKFKISVYGFKMDTGTDTSQKK